MENLGIDQLFSEWPEEINASLGKSNALCIALFGADRKLLFATPIMNMLFKGEPYKSLINPTYEKLITLQSYSSLVFEGLLTIGDYASINSSIVAQVYLKEGKLLVIGGVDTTQLVDQNISVLNLNHQINNLQRELLREKLTLENTLTQLSETNFLLRQVIATKDKFFAIIAHDLKSPFHSIIGLGEMLVSQVQQNDYAGVEKYATFILQTSNRAMALLMNLMEWAQSQTGRMDFKPEHYEMASLINDATLLSNAVALQKSIHIKRNLPQNVSVFADKAMLNTIFRNLISNAIKFTMPGGEITISAEVKQQEIVFFVRDTGIGMSKNRMEELFVIEKNYSTPGTNKEGGTGLGLILCREFVEKHGGKIWVESEEGKGSLFYFSLPYNGEVVKETLQQQPATSGKTENVRKLKILIAEDDDVSEMLISMSIEMYSKEILKAKTGVEAVEMCKKNPNIDLVFMDIQMPEISGYDATRQIREFNNQIVIIAQTAYGLPNDREKAIEAGCNDYITKPLSKNELRALIQKHFG
jgi:signal transduction histidine kinase/CheY-like chemotaxis protein